MIMEITIKFINKVIVKMRMVKVCRNDKYK